MDWQEVIFSLYATQCEYSVLAAEIYVFDYRVLPQVPLGMLNNMIYVLNHYPKNPKKVWIWKYVKAF